MSVHDVSVGKPSAIRSRISGESVINLKMENVRRRIAQIERSIAEFCRMMNALENEIQAEQDRSRIHDPNHFAYSTAAKAMVLRRDNLTLSIRELKAQLVEARWALAGPDSHPGRAP